MQAIARGNAALETQGAASFPGEYAGLEALSFVGLEQDVGAAVAKFSSGCANFTLADVSGEVSAAEIHVVECFQQTVHRFETQRLERAAGASGKADASNPAVRGGVHALEEGHALEKGHALEEGHALESAGSGFLAMMTKAVVGEPASQEGAKHKGAAAMELPPPPPPMLLLQESLLVAAARVLDAKATEAAKEADSKTYGLGGLLASATAAVVQGSKQAAAAATAAAGAVADAQHREAVAAVPLSNSEQTRGDGDTLGDGAGDGDGGESADVETGAASAAAATVTQGG
jgi:hypothetical protein